MSIAVLDRYTPTTVGSLAVAPVTVPTTPVRRRGGHLRLVPAAPAAGGQAVAAPAVDAPSAVVHQGRARSASMRITRRGRLVVTCTVLLALVLAFAGAISAMTPAGAASSLVVEPGMTLSQIAATELPGVPLSQAIADIQRANHLNGTSIAAGQELVIPGR